MLELEIMSPEAVSLEDKRSQWLAIARGRPPEWLASYVASPQASCVVVTRQEGSEPCSAYLERMEDVPYWAFVLAKSYLDDVGEWPLSGMQTEYALLEYGEHGDCQRALTEIMATIRPVWGDVEVIFVGEGKH
ncbi:MAG: hypothetical protein HW380_3845 [Magnetococcales bacterium]|nr:hypothetical protein [Magnetococcales bacterium]HIJ84167.1 hypothetical protein [Magnetococcales bacterium]